ncbi:PDI-like 5-3 [Perilla frutescens var. hirtella]|nr:PDI-like 5-3 [Perilla frutescens var. hirtella]KAH6815635.1 PDI-like 5-3 [Perilla frutescens var. frutescens]
MAVVEEIMKPKDRLANFLWFLTLPRVTYNEGENRVSITDKYWASRLKETWEKGAYQVGGEPMYKDLKHVFLRREADRADFDWLLQSFNEDGRGLSLRRASLAAAE